MKRIGRFFTLVGTEAIVLGIGSVGLGMATGIFVYGNQQIGSVFDPTPFQNFALAAGALTGLSVCLVAVVLYFLTGKLLHHTGFRYRFYLVFNGIAGAAIGLVTWAIISAAAESFGVVEGVTGFTAVIEAISFAVPGGLAGVFTGIILNLIRGYNS